MKISAECQFQVENCLKYCESIPVRQTTDYTPRQEGEIKAEVFPNFPLLAEKNRYKADEKGSRIDDDVRGGLCSKFPPHPWPIFSDMCLSSKKGLWLQKDGEAGES